MMGDEMIGEPRPQGLETVSSPPPPKRVRWRDMARQTYRLIRSNPTGRITIKVVIALTGLLVVAVGIALIPLPGPGWALVLLGLSIWAIEFVWARHLLRFTRQQLTRWIRWIGAQSWPIRVLIGLIGLVFVVFVVTLSLRYSLGIDVWAQARGHLRPR
jgi:uncharacterized protein (TIGR02611 family)